MKPPHPIIIIAAAILACMQAAAIYAQVPPILNYQGRVAVQGVNFDGSGQFKFALVNNDGSYTYWSNDGTSTAGSEPSAVVSVPVSKGLFSIRLGDAAIANMAAIDKAVFDNADLRLRIWFNNGTHGWQMLANDSALAVVSVAVKAIEAESLKRSQRSIYAGVFYAAGGYTSISQFANPGTQIQLPWTSIDNNGNGRGLSAVMDISFSGSLSAKFSLASIGGPSGCDFTLYRRSRAGITEAVGSVTLTTVGSNVLKQATLNHELDWTQYSYYLGFSTIPSNLYSNAKATIHEADFVFEE